MTVQAVDIEPEDNRARAGPSAWLSDPHFQMPERLPWSELSDDFMEAWGDPPWNKREHWEIIGPTGSGKTYLVETALQERYRRRKTGAILVCTTQDDEVFRDRGWPIAASTAEIQDTNVIFWPRTKLRGTRRKDFLRSRIEPLLDSLW